MTLAEDGAQGCVLCGQPELINSPGKSCTAWSVNLGFRDLAAVETGRQAEREQSAQPVLEIDAPAPGNSSPPPCLHFSKSFPC